jgi:hypothetical protein
MQVADDDLLQLIHIEEGRQCESQGLDNFKLFILFYSTNIFQVIASSSSKYRNSTESRHTVCMSVTSDLHVPNASVCVGRSLLELI